MVSKNSWNHKGLKIQMWILLKILPQCELLTTCAQVQNECHCYSRYGYFWVTFEVKIFFFVKFEQERNFHWDGLSYTTTNCWFQEATYILSKWAVWNQTTFYESLNGVKFLENCIRKSLQNRKKCLRFGSFYFLLFKIHI